MKLLGDFSYDLNFLFPLHFNIAVTLDRHPARAEVELTLGVVYVMFGIERKAK